MIDAEMVPPSMAEHAWHSVVARSPFGGLRFRANTIKYIQIWISMGTIGSIEQFTCRIIFVVVGIPFLAQPLGLS